jgi:AmmeMemoRadiSam system protein B
LQVRPPAVAGSFYPRDSRDLLAAVRHWLLPDARVAPNAAAPKAIIAPHAGYEYSGAVAGRAYALLEPGRSTITRVVLAGPSHRVAFSGLAVPSQTHFSTPLGAIAVDRAAMTAILALPQVQVLDKPHAHEHSLEVHLPFLQVSLAHFRLVPLLTGEASPADVGEVFERLWGGPDTLIVVSTDLSHYHDYDTARRMDAATSAAIEALRGDEIGDEDACGSVPLRGLLAVARRRGLGVLTVDVRNSGDAGGPHDQVVGYGAYAFRVQAPSPG